MAGNLKTNSVQLGDSATATQNFVWRTNVDGTATFARGNVGATSQDLITIDAAGNVQLTKTTNQSMIRLNTANGYGSTNTKIPRYVNVVTNQGSDITYVDSATLGASFTINTNGVYAISSTDAAAGQKQVGISLNSTQLTTSVSSINIGDLLSIAVTPTGFPTDACCTLYLAAGSVVRSHQDGTASTGQCTFTITRVA